jgi:hypothetical protein
MTMPGQRLRALARRWCSAETLERLIDPILADLQSEYLSARDQRPRRRRALLLNGYLGFWKAVMMHTLTGLVDSGDVALARSTLLFSACAFLGMTMLLVLPPLRGLNAHFGIGIIPLLVPQALPLSLPVALCVGVLCGARGHRTRWSHLLIVLALAAVSTGVAVGIIEWLIPAANQAFRELIFARLSGSPRNVHLERGLNELGFSGLVARNDPAALRQLQLLCAIAFASVPMSLTALGLAGYVRRAPVAASLGIVVSAGYVALMFLTDAAVVRSTGWSLLMLWLPNLLLLCVGALLNARSLRSVG